MRKEHISYIVIGIVAGLVLGFIVANWTTTAGTGGARTDNQMPQASVNSSSQNQDLPPGHPPVDGGQAAQPSPTLPANHPPIDGSQPMQAPPLPADSGMAGAAPGASSGGFVELPSLDPLPPGSGGKRAEQEYKNIQLLKGVPAERLPVIMNAFKSALGVDCTYCHVANQFEKDDKPAKKVAREMITLTRNNNKAMGGASRVTCFTCHRGQPRPPQS